MKITKEQLRQLIKEELNDLEEVGIPMSPSQKAGLARMATGMGIERGQPGYPPELEDEPEGGDPLRDAVRDFVDAVKNLV